MSCLAAASPGSLLQSHSCTQPSPSLPVGFGRMNSPCKQSKEGHPVLGEPQEQVQEEAEAAV